ncbi:GNAT family N-acetyltransferase [Leptotrichia sp. OH3620_COT-345]|uniref:GNAT family N-acetyltransferase n=1 Tax=Leptotrichia sp. OH3620_COT-345 TaxID=2491048 RepID=UPI000F64BA81|nr:GNAT family N-acetyltransferase [Leptotrichia sp. OH3620_COT-345]RRD41012.1 GNAT family N-acetyltransferase [Leptotrichia sp. OH3620_COT-345]
MIFSLKEYRLKNGKKYSIRSAEESDSKDIIKYRQEVTSETNFLLTYPEEIDTNIEKMMKYLRDFEKSTDRLFLLVYMNGEIIGMCSIVPILERIKVKHRTTFGLTVKKEFQGMGVGNILMNEIIENARKMNYEQIELEVYSNNKNAIKLYEKHGFQKWGEIPNGYKLKDGTYNNCIKMGKFLKK